jgi:hypothetical protein
MKEVVMGLTDLTMQNRNARALLEMVKPSEVPVVWAAANPALAAEAARWAKDPNRARRFTVDTVREAIMHCGSLEIIDAVYGADRRSGVESTCSSTLWKVRRLADGDTPDTRPVVQVYPTYTSTPALADGDADVLLSGISRYHLRAYHEIKPVLAKTSDAWLADRYAKHPAILFHEALRRERWDLVAKTPSMQHPAPVYLVADTIQDATRVEPHHARAAALLDAYPPKLRSLPWSPAAIAFAQDSANAVLLACAGHLEPGSLDLSGITTKQTAEVINITRDPRMVRWLWHKVMLMATGDMDYALMRDFVNSTEFSIDERVKLATIVPAGALEGMTFEPEHAKQFVQIALDRVGAPWLIELLGRVSRESRPTQWTHNLVSEIIETVPGAAVAMLKDRYGGFGAQLAASRIAESLRTADDWRSFFAVTDGGFPGTLDELIDVVTLCREPDNTTPDAG